MFRFCAGMLMLDKGRAGEGGIWLSNDVEDSSIFGSTYAVSFRVLDVAEFCGASTSDGVLAWDVLLETLEVKVLHWH